MNGAGFCGLGTLPRVARIAPHNWEEPCISGERGSGAVFFSGCTLRCVYCQNYEISAENKGRIITVEQLAKEFQRLESTGVHNINLVSPTPYVEAIKAALDIYKPSIPVVYNCSGYESVETINGLEGYVDVYLPDFKYSDNALAQKLSTAKNYAETALAAIGAMINQTGCNEFDNEGMMTKGVIIRHLVLPNHTKNSVEALRLLAENFDSPTISLMCQYIPHGRAADFPELNRRITRREYDKVKKVLFDLNLDGFVQDLSSADEKYIPVWDY